MSMSAAAVLSSTNGLANRRDEKDFRRARRHSLFVAGLKKLLPLSAIGCVVLFCTTAFISYSPLANVSISNISVEENKLIMHQPEMAGFDSKNRPFDVKAKMAVQDLREPDVIDLNAIDALLPMDEKSFADVVADSGSYNQKTERLQLRNNVVVKGARGMDIYLQDADIDIKNGSMKSNNPVQVTSKNANISAQTVEVGENGKSIIFRKRVKMTINRQATSPATATPTGESN